MSADTRTIEFSASIELIYQVEIDGDHPNYLTPDEELEENLRLGLKSDLLSNLVTAKNVDLYVEAGASSNYTATTQGVLL